MFVKKNANSRSANIAAGSVTTIAQGTTLNGDVECDTDMRIDGNVIGNVICKGKVVLGSSAIVQGDLTTANADVFGTVNGDVKTDDLTCLKAASTVNGNINTGRLQIEANAVFNGQCKMTSGDTDYQTGRPAKKTEPSLAAQNN